MRKKKKVFLIFLSVFIAIITGYMLFLLIGLQLKSASIKAVEISKISDGTYVGQLTGSRFSNKLDVTVQGGKIVDIKILKDMIVVLPDISTQIFNEVKERQSLQVDCVSGATTTSKAYLKSLENALEGNK